MTKFQFIIISLLTIFLLLISIKVYDNVKYNFAYSEIIDRIKDVPDGDDIKSIHMTNLERPYFETYFDIKMKYADYDPNKLYELAVKITDVIDKSIYIGMNMPIEIQPEKVRIYLTCPPLDPFDYDNTLMSYQYFCDRKYDSETETYKWYLPDIVRSKQIEQYRRMHPEEY